ncbi:hypothetical protein [Hymenobacter montanus]|nr:hypothetical protein [Hymenobacter montanus]
MPNAWTLGNDSAPNAWLLRHVAGLPMGTAATRLVTYYLNA